MVEIAKTLSPQKNEELTWLIRSIYGKFQESCQYTSWIFPNMQHGSTNPIVLSPNTCNTAGAFRDSVGAT